MTKQREKSGRVAIDPGSSRHEERGPWRAWLASLGNDASSALAAAQTYGALDPEGREAWLTALEEDSPVLTEAVIQAAYAPLLAVEDDGDRKARIAHAMKALLDPPPAKATRAWAAHEGGSRIVVLARPLVFSFVEVIACVFAEGGTIARARYVALASEDEVFSGAVEMGVSCILSEIDPEEAIDELAHAVVAHGRLHGALPEELTHCAHLFSARTPRYQEACA